MEKALINRINENGYKKLAMKVFVFVIIIASFDFTIGRVLNYFYFTQGSGTQYRTTYSLEKSTAEILVFGSSRANHHYVSEIFEKRSNLTCYNAGRDGNSIFYHYAILKGVLKRYSPKIVILDFSTHEFVKNQDSYDRISSLLPYYRKHPEIRSIVELRGPFEKFKMISNIYPFNSSILSIAIHNNAEYNNTQSEDIKGYMPLTKIWNEPIKTDSNFVQYELDSVKVKAYDSFINGCINSRVKLYIVCSPSFIKYTYKEYSVTIGQEIAERNNIKFYDFSNDSNFINNSSLFQDVGHLNNEGATLFSNRLIDKISETEKNIELVH
jgi:hypothetical protein